MLTKKQRKLMDYLKSYYEKERIMPTYREMLDALQTKSIGGLHGMVLRLETKGYIRRLPYQTRAIEILRDD